MTWMSKVLFNLDVVDSIFLIGEDTILHVISILQNLSLGMKSNTWNQIYLMFNSFELNIVLFSG